MPVWLTGWLGGCAAAHQLVRTLRPAVQLVPLRSRDRLSDTCLVATPPGAGYEPTSMRAIRARYNPYVQARGRCRGTAGTHTCIWQTGGVGPAVQAAHCKLALARRPPHEPANPFACHRGHTHLARTSPRTHTPTHAPRLTFSPCPSPSVPLLCLCRHAPGWTSFVGWATQLTRRVGRGAVGCALWAACT